MSTPTDSSIRLLIIEDHPLIREALLALFQKAADIDASAGGTREAVWLAQRVAPHVVVLDIASSEADPFDAAASLLIERPGVRTLFLDDAMRPAHIHKTLAVGGAGYWTKNASFDQLVGAVRRVWGGGLAFSPAAWRYVSPLGLATTCRATASPRSTWEPAELRPRHPFLRNPPPAVDAPGLPARCPLSAGILQYRSMWKVDIPVDVSRRNNTDDSTDRSMASGTTMIDIGRSVGHSFSVRE